MVATMGWYGKYHGSPPQPVSHRNQHFVYKTITSEHLQSRAATNLLGALVFLPFTCVPRAMKPASSLFQFELAGTFVKSTMVSLVRTMAWYGIYHGASWRPLVCLPSLQIRHDEAQHRHAQA